MCKLKKNVLFYYMIVMSGDHLNAFIITRSFAFRLQCPISAWLVPTVELTIESDLKGQSLRLGANLEIPGVLVEDRATHAF